MNEKNGFLYNAISLFEQGDRASRHNNYGAHIWTPDLEKDYGAVKGDPFTGADGRIYYTALYDDPETGTIASNKVIDNIWERSGGDTIKFATQYTGLPESDPTVQNYVQVINQNKSRQDYEGAVQRFKNRQSLEQKKDQLYSEFPEQEKKIDKLVESGMYSADGIRDVLAKVKTKVEDFDYDTFKNDVMTALDISNDEVEGAKNAFLRGYGNLKTMANVLGYQLGIDPEERVRQIAVEQSKLEDLPASETFDRAMNPENDFGQTLKELKADPIAVTTQLATESLTQFLPVGFAVGLPLAVGGAVIGAPIGLTIATTSFISSLGIEWASEILGSFGQQGVNVKNPDELAYAFTDPEINEKAKQEALEKGVPVAVFDAISGGVAGKYLQVARGMGFTRNLTAVGKEILTQAGLGGAGEAVGQAVALDPEEGEQFNIPAIVAESIVEVGTGAVQGTVRLTFDNGNTIEVPEDDPVVQDIVTARTAQRQEPTNEAQEVYSEKIQGLSNYKGKISIGFVDTPIIDVFTEQEMIAQDYNPVEYENDLIKEGEDGYVNDGVNRYRLSVPAQNYEFGDGTRRILLSENATQADFLEDASEAIYKRLDESNPELANDIDGWIASVVSQAQLNNEALPNTGAELFSKSFLKNLGYEITLPDYAVLPAEITQSFINEMTLEDGTNLTDGLIVTQPPKPKPKAEPKPEPKQEPIVEPEPEPQPEPEPVEEEIPEDEPIPEVLEEPTPTPEPDPTFNFKVGDIIKSTDGSNISLIVTDVSDDKFVRGVSTQTGDGKVISFYKNKNWKLEDENTLSEFQKENVEKYKPEPEPEVKEKPTKTKQAKGLEVKELDTDSIVIDENKFQPREEYNEQMIDDIANNFDPVKWDEPILWRDPKDNKLYVVSGHHRQLGVIKGKVGKATYKILPEGTTLEQARDYSEIGNLARTEQTTFENASVVRRRVDRGDSFVKINKDLPSISVGKAKSLYNLSFLDPKGKFKENYENTSGFKRIVSTASLIGNYRKKYDWMTNKHEDDIFTYLYNENAIEGDDQKIGLNLSMTLEKVDGMKDKPASILKQLRKDTARLPEDADEATKNEVEEFDRQISSITAQLEDTKSLSEEAKKIAKETDAKEADVYDTLRKDLQSQRRDIKKQKQELIESLNQEDPNQDSLFSLRPVDEKAYAEAFNKGVTRKEAKNARRDEKINRPKQFRDFFRTLSSQLNRINPKITEKIRRYQKKQSDLLDAYLKEVSPFGKTLKRIKKRAKTRRAKAEYVALKLALYNGDTTTVESILRTNRRIGQYRAFVQAQANLHEQAMAVGIDMGHIDNHFPREVTNYRAFFKYVSGVTASAKTSKLQEAFNDARDKRGRDLTDEEKVAIANALLRQQKGLLGEGTNWAKSRKIDKLTVDQLRFYDEPYNSLARYATGMTKMIANAQFLGGSPNRYRLRKLPVDTRIQGVGIYDSKVKKFLLNENNALIVFKNRLSPQAIKAMERLRLEEQARTGLPYMGLEDQVGSMTLDLQGEFQLNNDQAERVASLLSSYFKQDSMSPFVSGLRNMGYISTMGSVFSAVTQLGDLGVAIYRSGKGVALGALRPSTYTRVISEMFKSVTRLNKYKLKQLGVDNRILQELSDDQTSLQRALTWVFRLSGLTLMDRVGKETFINTSMKKYEKGARQVVSGRNTRLTRDLNRRLSRKFNDKETQELIRDLASGKRTELTELLAYSELLDVQPVAKSEVPVGYLEYPNGRVFYMLKTFMLKRFDVFVNETNMLKKEGKHSSAMMNMVMLGTILAMSEASADSIKDWMAGRKTPLPELVWSNLLKLAGLSRYHYYNFINSRPSQAILKVLVPPYDYIDDPVTDLRFLHSRLETYKNTRTPAKYALQDFNKRGAKWVRHIPIFGKHLYWMDKDSDMAKIIDESAPFMSTGYGKRVLKERQDRQK